MDYLIKVGLFTFFVFAIGYFTDKILSIFQTYIAMLPLTSIMCQFGVFQGLNLFMSIIVSSFVVKQIISFWK